MHRLLFSTLLLALAACQNEPFEQVGYFKDDASNRVFVLQATEHVSQDQVRQKVEKLAHTDGQMTMTYIYQTGTNGVRDIVTLATSYIGANDQMHSGTAPAWRWRYVQHANGATSFTDCENSPDLGACLTHQ